MCRHVAAASRGLCAHGPVCHRANVIRTSAFPFGCRNGFGRDRETITIPGFGDGERYYEVCSGAHYDLSGVWCAVFSLWEEALQRPGSDYHGVLWTKAGPCPHGFVSRLAHILLHRVFDTPEMILCPNPLQRLRRYMDWFLTVPLLFLEILLCPNPLQRLSSRPVRVSNSVRRRSTLAASGWPRHFALLALPHGSFLLRAFFRPV